VHAHRQNRDSNRSPENSRAVIPTGCGNRFNRFVSVSVADKDKYSDCGLGRHNWSAQLVGTIGRHNWSAQLVGTIVLSFAT